MQELFYFANCIFCQQKNLLFKKGFDNFEKFFDMYKTTVEKMTTKQGIKFENFKCDPRNYGNKVIAEIIYTVLNNKELSSINIIEKIWNGYFLNEYYKSNGDQAHKSRLRLSFIESTLTKDLKMYKTQGLQSALYKYLTPENSGITREELDIRRELLINVKIGEELEKFKNDTLAPELQKQKEKLETEGRINTKTLEGIFILAANNGINIPLKENDGLDSLILNYINQVDPKEGNKVTILSNIIDAVLHPSVEYMSSEQDNGIIKALKTKLSEIKQEIREKGIYCNSYVSYTVITIDKFIDCYESKKSKKQSSESAKPAEEEENSDSNFLKYLINITKNPKGNVDTNKVKAIKTLIEYYQLKNASQDKPETFEDQATTIESQDRNKESESKTESKFEELLRRKIIPNILETSNPESYMELIQIKTQHEIKNRKVDFYITFKKNCSIEIAKNFKIPIAKGTKIVIEADGALHFENGILPENLKKAQDTITTKTKERNDEIKGALIDNKDLYTSLKDKVLKLEDNENHLLECACYLQRFRQRRELLDPTIDSESSKKFYQTEATQGTKKAEQNSRLLEMTPELKELQEILQDKDVEEVIPESIQKSNLFFSIPLLTSCMTKDKKYQEEEIQKVFLNCFINAYCSQALSNLKEFYSQKEDKEKKGIKNTSTDLQGENGTLTSNKETVGIRALEQINVRLTSNRETVGIRALEQIKYAKNNEKEEIQKYLNSATPQNTQTSGQGNVL